MIKLTTENFEYTRSDDNANRKLKITNMDLVSFPEMACIMSNQHIDELKVLLQYAGEIDDICVFKLPDGSYTSPKDHRIEEE